MVKGIELNTAPTNDTFKTSYIATDWTYDTAFSIVSGHWCWQQNVKHVFLVPVFIDLQTHEKVIASPTLPTVFLKKFKLSREAQSF